MCHEILFVSIFTAYMYTSDDSVGYAIRVNVFFLPLIFFVTLFLCLYIYLRVIFVKRELVLFIVTLLSVYTPFGAVR